MAEILHRIGISASREEVFEALSTLDGLKGWWTTTTFGESVAGSTLDFRFGEHSTKMKVEALDAPQEVRWTCTSSTPDWEGTEVTFRLEETQGKTAVRFSHSRWKEAGDFFSHCSTKWATFLVSLKELVETGAGRPFPNDVAV